MSRRVTNTDPSAGASPKPDLSRAHWHKSSYSNGQANCVEVATNLPGVVVVRDSKDKLGSILVFDAEGWREFIESFGGRNIT